LAQLVINVKKKLNSLKVFNSYIAYITQLKQQFTQKVAITFAAHQ